MAQHDQRRSQVSTSGRTHDVLALLILERDAREDVTDVDWTDRHGGGGRVQRSIADGAISLWPLECERDTVIIPLAVPV